MRGVTMITTLTTMHSKLQTGGRPPLPTFFSHGCVRYYIAGGHDGRCWEDETELCCGDGLVRTLLRWAGFLLDFPQRFLSLWGFPLEFLPWGHGYAPLNVLLVVDHSPYPLCKVLMSGDVYVCIYVCECYQSVMNLVVCTADLRSPEPEWWIFWCAQQAWIHHVNIVTAWCSGRHGRVHVVGAVAPRVAHDKCLHVQIMHDFWNYACMVIKQLAVHVHL